MSRSLSIRNLYDKKFQQLAFDGLYLQAIGNPESNGIWIIWGKEKNGKTWWALKLADYLSKQTKVLYISAEEGTGMDFVDACKRAGLHTGNKNLKFEEYLSINELTEKLKSRKSAKVIFLDNCTVYADELRAAMLRQLTKNYPDKLFILVAHEEKREPYTALAKLARKLAKIIMHVQGLATHVSGRCPGGIISIDEQKATLYWGTEIITKTETT
jgi:hypothetical protein